jgi:drug/metabolite transporter (DMT)-like permease
MSTWIPYAWALGSISLSSLAQICLKLAVRGHPTFRLLISQPWLALGLAAYALSAGLWLVVLHHLPLTRAYPLVSLNFVLVLLGSVWVLHERATWTMGLGIGCIVIGLCVLSLPMGT